MWVETHTTKARSLGQLGRNAEANTPGSLRGFTLIELMVVIVIISLLLALLVPAIQRARIAANEARVVTEIKQLDSAIVAFKAKYGVEPPSQFHIYLNQANWQTDPASMALVRRIWPQFDFSMGANNGVIAYPRWWSGILTSPGGLSPGIHMTSGECLLFFLGGIIDVQGAGQSPRGFAKNPLNPFCPTVDPVGGNTPVLLSQNREGPFFEFTDTSRISDFDKNGINEWYDPLPSVSAQKPPYLYFSSYEGRGYNLAELPVSGTNYLFVSDVYRVWAPSAGNTTEPTPPLSPSAAPSGSQLLAAQKPQSWQIISAGYDGVFGLGGVFNQSLPNSGLQPTPNVIPPVYPDSDNLTNFNGGRLNP